MGTTEVQRSWTPHLQYFLDKEDGYLLQPYPHLMPVKTADVYYAEVITRFFDEINKEAKERNVEVDAEDNMPFILKLAVHTKTEDLHIFEIHFLTDIFA